MRNAEEATGTYGSAPGAQSFAGYGAGYQGEPAATYAAQHTSHYATAPVPAPSHAASFGPLFRELRRALGLTLPTAASFSGTRIEVIVALETGDLAALPPWPETVQVVSRLTGLAQIDPQPVLALIYQELSRTRMAVAEAVEAPARQMAPVSGTPLPTMAASWGGDAAPRSQGRPDATRGQPPKRQPVEDDEDDSQGFVGRGVAALRSMSGLGRIAALSAVLIAAGGTIAQGSAIKASFATLQTPISRLLKGAENYLIWRSAPVKDGLRWISVDDPRSRRGDKLKVGRPSV